MSEAAQFDLAIVGAGPAGLMAAIAACQAGPASSAAADYAVASRRVLVCEQLERPGAKLLATGGGRCNLTTLAGVAEIMARFGRQGRFMAPALEAMDPDALRQFFLGLGVRTVEEPGGQVYPASNSAATVLQALTNKARQLGVELRTRTRVSGLWLEKSAGGESVLRGLKTDKESIAAPAVLIATGGKSYPNLGATGTGYELARQAGHAIVPPTPALVGLTLAERWLGACAGSSITARVWIDLPRQPRSGLIGQALFTHRGISGPVVLDISGDVAALLARHKPVPIRLDLRAGLFGRDLPRDAAGQVDLPTLINRWRRDEGSRPMLSLLDRLLPHSLAEAVAGQLRLGPVRAAEMPADRMRTLIDWLSGLPLSVAGTEGFDKAIVTRGGVSLKDVAPRTLESKLTRGLFFAGEVLDLDGPCGGYNLTWAFASGHLAGRTAGTGHEGLGPGD